MPNVHKDFHGALSYGLQFVEDHYGAQGLREFLAGLVDTVYKPLCDDLRARGLEALREHWQRIFELEQGEYELAMEGETLVLTVHRCPAIIHMRQHGYAVADHYCDHTRIVNAALCAAAGCESSVACDQAAGACVQRFWRKR